MTPPPGKQKTRLIGEHRMKRFCLILILLLLLPTFLMGCTDKDTRETADPAVPTAVAPAPSNGAASPVDTGKSAVPVGTERTGTAEGDTQEAPVITTEVPFSGMEIEDSYVETVGDGVGIGGN